MAYVQTRESINVQTILLPEPRRFVNNHRLPPVASESGRQNLKEKKKKKKQQPCERGKSAGNLGRRVGQHCHVALLHRRCLASVSRLSISRVFRVLSGRSVHTTVRFPRSARLYCNLITTGVTVVCSARLVLKALYAASFLFYSGEENLLWFSVTIFPNIVFKKKKKTFLTSFQLPLLRSCPTQFIFRAIEISVARKRWEKKNQKDVSCFVEYRLAELV